MQLPSGRVETPDVVVVGAGPTGLMLACELALAGTKVKLLDERTDMPNITRAFAVHARTLELLDARGLADELVPRGVPVREIAPPGGTTLNLSELPTRYGMVLIVPQSGTEKVLQSRADALGVQIVRGAEVIGLTQDGDGVSLQCAPTVWSGATARTARCAASSASILSASSTRRISCWPTCS
jgi:2-polyprenyl-6-methoxyphenol hydroxylase-like FAD-dependent oxidoreductase